MHEHSVNVSPMQLDVVAKRFVDLIASGFDVASDQVDQSSEYLVSFPCTAGAGA